MPKHSDKIRVLSVLWLQTRLSWTNLWQRWVEHFFLSLKEYYHVCHLSLFPVIQELQPPSLSWGRKFLAENPCNKEPCLNGGECLQTAKKDDYACNCKAGFGGKNCDQGRFLFCELIGITAALPKEKGKHRKKWLFGCHLAISVAQNRWWLFSCLQIQTHALQCPARMERLAASQVRNLNATARQSSRDQPALKQVS